MRKRFGKKMARICLDGGMSCPNLDGRKGQGGCIYCLDGSSEFSGSPQWSISEQIRYGMALMKKKWPEAGFIAYFQSHTNTYAPLHKLRSLYEEALKEKFVEGLSIGTRSDCLSDKVCDLLGELSKRTYLTVELGLQTVHDKTGILINRCHTMDDFLRGYEKLQKRNILTGIHLIDGLPGETQEMMMKSVRQVAALHPHLIKLHLLYIEENTALARWYREGKYTPMERDEFVKVICGQMELLPPETIVGRLTGDGAAGHLLAPQWSRKKLCVLNEIDKELKKRDSWQGKFFLSA